MKRKNYFVAGGMLAVLLLMSVSVFAQPPQGRRSAPVERPAPVSAEQAARTKTDLLAKELGLTAKQDKKVYKLYLSQAKQLSGETARPGSGSGASGGMGMPGGGPQDGMGGGMGRGRGMQGGPPSGGGRGGMGPGGDMGSREGRRDDMGQGEAPAMNLRQGGAARVLESDKEIAARDKKMKKILSASQYGQWKRWETEDLSRHARRLLDGGMGKGADR